MTRVRGACACECMRRAIGRNAGPAGHHRAVSDISSGTWHGRLAHAFAAIGASAWARRPCHVLHDPVNDRPPTLEAQAPLDYATAQPDKAGRFHQLDGLRAVAVTLVLIHHSFTNAVATALLQVAADLQAAGRAGASRAFV